MAWSSQPYFKLAALHPSLDQVYGESINRSGLDPVVENELNQADLDDIDNTSADKNSKSLAKITTNEKMKRKPMYKLMHKDICQVGRVSLNERNIIKRRPDAKQHRTKKQ